MAVTSRAVLIDLDDTLFDHRASASRALRAAAACDGALASVAFAQLETRHRAILEQLHRAVLDGGMTVDEAREQRFRTLVEEFGPPGDRCDAARLDRLTKAYRGAYLQEWACLAGVHEFLAELVRRGARIAVVTNNIVREQTAKLKRLDLERFVDALVVSEAVGASKPDARIFTHALEAIGASPDAAVMVGDSWTADIEGARAAGIRAVWFNPDRQPLPAAPAGVVDLPGFTPAEAAADLVLATPAP